MVNVIEVYYGIWNKFEWPWPLFKITALREKKKFCADLFDNFKIDLDGNYCIAATWLFDEAHTNFILHNQYTRGTT